MAFFPNELPPKRLKRETLSEVDDSPSIYNARDYNIHLREVLALFRYLVGRGISIDTDGSVLDLVSKAIEIFRKLTDDGLITTHSGIIASGATIQAPPGMPKAFTSGALGTGDTTITVLSTDDFPTNGLLTKFNAIVPGSIGIGTTNQEVIRYTGKTSTTFTGCTRSVEGTAQAVASDKTALILPGRASLFLGTNGWQNNVTTGVLGIYLSHDAALKVTASIESGTNPAAQKFINAEYALTIAGTFENIDLSTVLG